MTTNSALFLNLKVYGLTAFTHLLIVLILTLPAVQWLATSQSIWVVPFGSMPRGQLIYLLSKLTALYAISLLGLQFAYGFAGLRVRSLLGYERGLQFHRALGLAALSLLLAHASLFILGASLRTGHFASHFALPNLFADYYVSRIALGWWAAVALIIAAVFALLRRHFVRVWRLAHWLTLPAFPAVVVHSLSIGTESRMPVMLAAYACMCALLTIAVVLRFSTRRSTSALSE